MVSYNHSLGDLALCFGVPHKKYELGCFFLNRFSQTVQSVSYKAEVDRGITYITRLPHTDRSKGEDLLCLIGEGVSNAELLKGSGRLKAALGRDGVR